jgi:hypothetical protein
MRKTASSSTKPKKDEGTSHSKRGESSGR